MNLMLDSTLKVSIVVLIGLVVSQLLRHRSAAVRHWILAATMLCALAAPFMQTIVPGWGVPTIMTMTFGADRVEAPRPSAPSAGKVTVAADESVDVVATRTASPPAQRVLATAERFIVPIWTAGVLLSLLVLVVGIARLAWIAARAARITSGAWPRIAAETAGQYGLPRPVQLLQADHPSLLITWGLVHPKVLVPVSALRWSDDRIRLVLRHELAHARRGDWIVQLAGEALRSAYWFNPLLWIACTRLRQESEHACDDEVLAGGVEPAEYAAHLLEVARELRPRFPPLPAPAITRSSTLERRFHAMLDARLTRTPASKAFRFISAALLISATALIAAAQSGSSTLSGVVTDSMSAPIPGAAVVLVDKASSAKFEVRTDDRGFFQFVPLPDNTYTLEIAYPGLRKAAQDIRLSGGSVRYDFKLALGSLQETVTIVGGGRETSFVAALGGAPDERVQEKDLQRSAYKRDLDACTPSAEGGRVRPPRKIKDVRPVYSANLQSQGIAGTVVLDALIATDGLVKELHVVKSVHPELDAAAVDAVRQWQFDGTLLNCVPAEVQMKVSLNFKVQ